MLVEQSHKQKDILDVKGNSSSYLSNHEPSIRKLSNPDLAKISKSENLLYSKHLQSQPFATSEHSAMNLDQNFEELDFLEKCDFDEKILIHINNVSCLSETSNFLHSKESKTSMDGLKNLFGKLILTSYRLLFLPYHYDDRIDLGSLFSSDPNLQLFNNKSSPLAVVIPLSFIYEIKASE